VEEGMNLQYEVKENTILQGLVGSTVHGVGTGSDDRDEMGICIEDPRHVIGLHPPFEQYIWRTQPEGVRSGPGDLDLVVYSLRKWASLALKGNPSIILLLFTPEDSLVKNSSVGTVLREEIAPAFLSKKLAAPYLGYMTQQRERLLGQRGQMRVTRTELIEKYGYDTKYAYHMLRLGIQGSEILRTGKLTIPMDPIDIDFLLRVRNGQYSLDTVVALAKRLEEQLTELKESSPLPDEPDFNFVEEFVVRAYDEVWDSGVGYAKVNMRTRVRE
jgi:predicted nucleotidyltransferase